MHGDRDGRLGVADVVALPHEERVIARGPLFVRSARPSRARRVSVGGCPDPYDLYLVLAGGVLLLDRRDDRVVFVIEEGDFVGELGMLMGQRAFLPGVAMEGTAVLRVRVEELRRLVEISGELSDVLLSAFDARRRLLKSMGEGGLVFAGDDDSDLHRLQEFAERNQLPYRAVLRSDASAWSELAKTTALPEAGTVVVTGERRVMTAPTTRDLATALGIDLWCLSDDSKCDLLVVGAGPAGLAAAVYGASEGLDVVVVEDIASGVRPAARRGSRITSGFRAAFPGLSWRGPRCCRPSSSERGWLPLAPSRGCRRCPEASVSGSTMSTTSWPAP
jgi:CRP-like cAMP-binding protein